MNERIDKLALLCYEECGDYHLGSIRHFNQQKFAELIQKDMIKQCRDMFIVGSVSWNLLNEKLELFGVE